MTNPKRSENASEKQHRKLSSRPRQYVDVNDLRGMLKLGLGLHGRSDPRKRWNKASDGLARLANADAWVAMVLDPRTRSTPEIARMVIGGKAPGLARAAAERVQSDFHKEDGRIAGLFKTRKPTPGRVLAKIENDRAIYTFLAPEISAPATWISLHRGPDSAPFVERERRMVELFHSQSAWLLLQLDL